ncbi:glycosyltransferase family 4 protein [Desulfovibrio gilichinskyi]|uniref:Glycosyltransferase involved in cell wall bisynthesis n=1 Tax=Desulfovibrio gilichinskyi TaxID=1519643 RepID=A0A1X7C9A0_9BACT|nr:glycosyltransferase family 4 protein [Desulfovibrio gilichinskyi]SME92399.1 Glycosyltransferase involved in cell wall bisynthesis [Desulfovibrio gilichinskyi]
MRIAFFAPHKPIDDKTPSGDLIIGKSLHDYLCAHGHEILIASRMRLRNITTSPSKWPMLYFEYNKTLKRVKSFNPDVWLTYHSYYKSPDLFGPEISTELGIPYLIYQGVFSTKHRRNLKTWLGFMANKTALLHADHVFANKEIDHENLSRIILPEKLTRTRPGINPDEFKFCLKSRTAIRKTLNIENKPVLMSTAMFRSGVKEQSLRDLILAFANVLKIIPEARLLIAGDGEARERLISLAKQKAGDQIIFLGRINREDLFKYYSAADIFVYPGYNEALGMVYLEAQSIGLPVIAYSTRGPREAVAHDKTGLLSPEGDINSLANNIINLFKDKSKLQKMNELAPIRIKELFDQNLNLRHIEEKIRHSIVRRSY